MIIKDVTPLIDYFETDTPPQELASRLVGIQHRYAIAALKDDEVVGKQQEVANDLVELNLLYERLLRICELNK
jgi:hypothetical protein